MHADMVLIRINTVLGCTVIRGQDARTARAIARSWLRHSGVDMGGDTASVCVGVRGGRWHSLGQIGNPQRNAKPRF